MSPIRCLRVPGVLIGTLAMLLVLAAGASAETLSGESAAPVTVGPAPNPETSIVKGSASYETSGGNASVEITTAAAPDPASEASFTAYLLSAPVTCDTSILSVFGSNPESLLPTLAILSYYNASTAQAVAASSLTGSGGELLPATKTPSGTTTSISVRSNAIAGKSYNCAMFMAQGGALDGGASLLAFPLTPPPPPPPPPPAPQPAPPVAPVAPAALSIHKLKPLKLKVKKWRRVKVKLTNTGGTATRRGSLRVKAPAGVVVKPKRQKLRVLAPGHSRTLSVRVKLTAKAKKKSALRLTGTAPGVKARASLVIRRQSRAAPRRHPASRRGR